MTFARLARLALIAAALPFNALGAVSPGQLYYERTLVGAAGARCKLFTPQVAASLAASTQQARGAALRGGADRVSLAAVEKRALVTAGTLPCNSPDLAVVADRVRQGFAGYAKLTTMTFPGELSSWTAERGTASRVGSAWRLFQAARTPMGEARLGLAQATDGGAALVAVAAWPGALAASGARIVVRDTVKFTAPYVGPGRKDLNARAAPRAASTAILAADRSAAPAALLPQGVAMGAAFRFPARAITAIEALDPREALVLELVYPARDGERVERVPMEVGDFAAGRAFLVTGK